MTPEERRTIERERYYLKREFLLNQKREYYRLNKQSIIDKSAEYYKNNKDNERYVARKAAYGANNKELVSAKRRAKYTARDLLGAHHPRAPRARLRVVPIPPGRARASC